MNELKIGDIVQLKSSGPQMTVNSIGADFVSCLWFCGNERTEGIFAKMALKLIAVGQEEDGK